MKNPIIHGLLREGETMNIIAPQNSGKSFLAYQLAVSVATGLPWIGFNVEPGNALIISSDLRPETHMERIKAIMLGASGSTDLKEKIYFFNLHGAPFRTANQAAVYFDAIDRFEIQKFKIIVVDSMTRLLADVPHDNDLIASIYAAVDRCAERLGAGIVLIHHAQKPNPEQSGGRMLSRATDTMMTLEPFVGFGDFYVHCQARSWPPIKVFAARFDFPLWSRVENLGMED